MEGMADEKILGDWFRETSESLAMLESECEALAESEGRYAAQHPERATRYAEAIHSIVITDSPEQCRDLVDAVVSVADAEQAELRAEVERTTTAAEAAIDHANIQRMTAEAKVKAAEALHVIAVNPTDWSSDWCAGCGRTWPCPTITALAVQSTR